MMSEVLNANAQKSDFSVEIVEGPYPVSDTLAKDSLAPYQGVTCRIHFPKCQPNGDYVLFCPDTGSPFVPYFHASSHFVSDKDGTLSIDALKLDFPTQKAYEQYIALFAHPGFCSNWYVQNMRSKELYHTTFLYQPIIDTNEKGQSLEIRKKECGGNFLEIRLSGFEPYEEVCCTTTTCSEDVVYREKVDHTGCYSFFVFSPEKKAEKGTFVVTVDLPEKALRATVDWNRKTLFLNRKTKTVSHTKLVYKPIVSKSADGKELRIEKKECGGNMLLVTLNGFLPHQECSLVSNSEGEMMAMTIRTNERGEYGAYFWPQVVGKKQGIDTITVNTSECSLQAACDWNEKTLELRRKQPLSFVKKSFFILEKQ